MNYLSLSLIAKNEDPYIEEWVNFHRAVGVEHFYIYDNDSTNPIKILLKKYIDAGIVTVIDFPGRLMQMSAYKHCLSTYGKKSKWIGFVDCDEFILPKSKDLINEILTEFESYGALTANWLFYGSGGLETKPDGLVTENFIMSSHKNWCLNNHVKTIVQPEFTHTTGDPHHFIYKSGYYAVTEDHKRINGSVVFKCKDCWTPNAPETHFCGEINTNKLQVNHYYTKSKEEFMIRYHGGSCYAPEPTRSNMNGFNSITRVCNIKNVCALKFTDKTKSLFIK